jgi:S1-C subfamily serine protease
VRLDQAPLAPRVTQASAPEAAVQSLLGMEFAELDEATARQLGYESASGVVVGRVTPNGPAQRQGRAAR